MKHGLFRIFAFVADFSLSYVFYSYLCSYGQFVQYRDDLQALMFGFYEIKSQYFSILLMVYFIHIALRFFATLILSVSFSQFLLGMKSHGTFFWNRIGGGARVLLELITSPFILFDVPCLLAKPTLKELSSFTRVTTRKDYYAMVSSIIITPVFLIAAFFSPVLTNIGTTDGVVIKTYSTSKIKLESSQDFEKFSNYNSEFFKLSTFTSFSQTKFIPIPSFEIIRIGAKFMLRPYLYIYDQANRGYATFKRIAKADLGRLLKVAEEGNPLFGRRYPKVKELVYSSGANYMVKKYKAKFKEKKVFSKALTQEVEELLRSSFALSAKNAFEHISSDGPFVQGHMRLRRTLLEYVGENFEDTVELATLGNTKFFRIYQHSDKPDMKRISFFSVDSAKSYLFQLDYSKKFELERFEGSFFSSSKWYFDYTDIFVADKNKTELSLLDYFWKVSLKKDSAYEEYLYHMYFDLATKALDIGDEVLIERVKSELKAVLNVKYFKQDRALKLLKNAFEEKDSKFFNVKGYK